MKAKDRLVAKRRLLPVTEVDPNYEFIGTNNDEDLLGLFVCSGICPQTGAHCGTDAGWQVRLCASSSLLAGKQT